MRILPKLLLLLSAPAGLVGYFLGAQLLAMLAPSLADGVLMVFIPLFVASLCMMPFLIPFFDQRAKADLEAHRAQQAGASGTDGSQGDAPDAEPGRR
jgi:hypothetical protein